MKALSLKGMTDITLQHYERRPQQFWEGTKDHDVSQNYEHFLKHISHEAPWNLLDLGCGPGRDVLYFSSLGHQAHGLDGCEAFCKMARDYTQCEVFHQNFLELQLASHYYHGIFANASLFHIPRARLTEVLQQLNDALVEGGILFSSNPRGEGEVLDGSRYANYMELEDYQTVAEAAGFQILEHYYRPEHLPLEARPWLACVFRK